VTEVSHSADSRPRFFHLVVHEFRYDWRAFRRNTQSIFFTLILPVLFLVIFASIFRNADVGVPGGRIGESVYYVPGLTAYGVIAAAFANLVVTVVRIRETGIYKRQRATPIPASAVIAARALIGALTALAIAAVILVLGWAVYRSQDFPRPVGDQASGNTVHFPASKAPGQRLRLGGYLAASRKWHNQDQLNESAHLGPEPVTGYRPARPLAISCRPGTTVRGPTTPAADVCP
jgi:ABC-2 type transporter